MASENRIGRYTGFPKKAGQMGFGVPLYALGPGMRWSKIYVGSENLWVKKLLVKIFSEFHQHVLKTNAFQDPTCFQSRQNFE